MTEKAKVKKSQTGSKGPPEGQSQDYQRFEELVKRVVKVPKEELDRREAEAKRKRSS